MEAEDEWADCIGLQARRGRQVVKTPTQKYVYTVLRVFRGYSHSIPQRAW
jgi:hypothetical protein